MPVIVNVELAQQSLQTPSQRDSAPAAAANEEEKKEKRKEKNQTPPMWLYLNFGLLGRRNVADDDVLVGSQAKVARVCLGNLAQTGLELVPAGKGASTTETER